MKQFKELKHNLKSDMSSLRKIKVALLGDSATQLLATALRGAGVERGYCLELFESGYNQIYDQLYDSTSELYQYNAKYNIFFQSTHKLLEQYSRLSDKEQRNLADDRIGEIRNICDSVSGNIIYYNYPEIDNAIFGSYSNKVESSFLFQIRKLNFELMLLSQEYSNLFICDIASLQNKYGRDWMFDSKVYVSTEMLLSIASLPYVAYRTLDIICAIEGNIKKCIVLDLDNTIWGGIIGDDGWENIKIGHGLGIGKAFTEFQEWIKMLKNRGIIIAICSKNDEEKAKEPFEKNPEMIISLDDISVFIANWNNKVDNLRAIQQILNIGFDSIVFIDDNPFERNFVRENIRDIIVPEMPRDPAKYLEFLYSLNLFETASSSSADKDRTKQYQIESKRFEISKKFTNESDFLRSLEMKSIVEGFNKFNVPRVAQLSQRSNQFNLRTIRYTEEQVWMVNNDPLQKGFTFTLEDRFGDNGLIAVVILKDSQEREINSLFIDTWFMSCRVLKRGMENFILNTIVSWAKENGFVRIIGEYIPTAKNEIVRRLYEGLGFMRLENNDRNLYVLDVDSYSSRNCYIERIL